MILTPFLSLKLARSPLGLSGQIKALSALTIRKVDAGYAIALPGPVPKGAYALSIYSPAGRLIKSITGVRKGYDVVFLPLKSLKGTYIIRYSDVNGGITKRTCLVR